MGFACYQEKEQCRKGLAELFKQRKFGPNKDVKLFAANDCSQRVQKLRKAKNPNLQKLRVEGKQAFLVYPATIKIRDGNGRVRDAEVATSAGVHEMRFLIQDFAFFF